MNRIEEDRKKQWEAILKLGKPQPDQSSRLLTDMDLFGDVRQRMEEAAKFYHGAGYIASEDANGIINVVEAKTALIKDAEIKDLSEEYATLSELKDGRFEVKLRGKDAECQASPCIHIPFSLSHTGFLITRSSSVV